MAQDVGGHGPADVGAIGHALDQDLMVRGAMPTVSCKAKCPSRRGCTRGERGMMRRLVWEPYGPPLP